MKVSIVGAGFSGLTLAYYLVKRGVEVEILEKSARAGGLIGTTKNSFGVAEAAANGILNSALTEELFADIGVSLATRNSVAYKKRYILRSGRPRRWPLGIFETLIFGIKFALTLLTGRLKPKPNETVLSYARRIGGAGFEKNLLTPGLQGIYAGDVARLSATFVFGRFFIGKRKRKPKIKGTVLPAGGMAQLVESLKIWLEKQDVQMRFQSDDEPTGEVLVVATSAWDAAEYLKDRAPIAATALKKAESVPVVSVTMMFPNRMAKPEGFGCLFPREEKCNSLGVLFMSDVFGGRGKGRTETWILGGALNPGIVSVSDAELERRILTDRVRLTGIMETPNSVVIHRWARGLPHYTREWHTEVKNLKLPENVYLTGNYLGRLGLSQILEGNKELAERIHG